MAPLIKVKFRPGAVEALEKSPEMQQVLLEHGQRMADAAGDGFEAEVNVGSTRARCTVFTATVDAMLSEATDRTLTRSIDAGR